MILCSVDDNALLDDSDWLTIPESVSIEVFDAVVDEADIDSDELVSEDEAMAVEDDSD